MTRPAAELYGEWTTSLSSRDILADVLGLARQCLVDAVACAAFGARLDWSRIVADHVRSGGVTGRCRLGGGLPAFVDGGGGMVKRLHLGRAAEGGVLAADLAARGYEGPAGAIDGPMGMLHACCPRVDLDRLGDGLGSAWETRTLCIKRYACHVTAQAAIELCADMRRERPFDHRDVVSVGVGVADKVLSHHSDPRPTDVAGAQYNLPFALACSIVHDPEKPSSFARGLRDADVRSLAERIRLGTQVRSDEKWGAEVEIVLGDGTVLAGDRGDFCGCPDRPLGPDGVARKFRTLTDTVLPPDPVAAFLDT